MVRISYQRIAARTQATGGPRSFLPHVFAPSIVYRFVDDAGHQQRKMTYWDDMRSSAPPRHAAAANGLKISAKCDFILPEELTKSLIRN